MRRKEQAAPAPEAPNPARIRSLLDDAAAAHNAGEVMHGHPALEALSDHCGALAYYALALYPRDYHITSDDLDKLEAGLVRTANSEHVEAAT